MDKLNENRELNEREINGRAPVLASMPRRLIVTLSTKCNAHCIMCEVRHGSWEIPRSTLDEIVGLFPYLESVAWQGGEVFFLDFFAPVFAAALKYPGMKQTIVSNGLLLDEAWIEKIVAANIELAISIDGTTKEVYEKIRAGSRYDILLRNIRLLNEARRRTGSRMSLRMHTVVMRSNYRQIEDFLALAEEYGFDALHMMPLWGTRCSGENIFLPGNEAIQEEVRLKTARVEQRARELGIEYLNSLPLPRSPQTEPDAAAVDGHRGGDTGTHGCRSQDLFCYLPWQQMNVDPGGGVRPGCLCAEPIGQVPEDSLVHLWNGERMRRYRHMVLSGGKGWCSARCTEGSVPAEMRRI
jgi:MoaA/NifB/PqqE/SkfB family radical SAM enzyme